MRQTLFLIGLFLVLASPTSGQEIYVHTGLVNMRGTSTNVVGYGVGYFQPVSDHAVLSLTYINQGHFIGHHRDGFALQAWWRQMLTPRYSIAAGVGPFAYFDTTGPRDASLDHHGAGGIFSIAATLHTNSRFLLQIRGNWIETAHSINTLAATVAVGYRLDATASGTAAGLGSPSNTAKQNEIAVFGGETVLNQFHSARSAAGAIEYRRRFGRYVEWTFSALREGDVAPIDRFGPVSQLWVVRNFYGDRLALGVGAGPYLTFDRADHERKTILTGPVVSLTGAYRFTPSWLFRATWSRVTTNFSHDTDVFMAGLGYTF